VIFGLKANHLAILLTGTTKTPFETPQMVNSGPLDKSDHFGAWIATILYLTEFYIMNM
jgi:hypothetical protein